MTPNPLRLCILPGNSCSNIAEVLLERAARIVALALADDEFMHDTLESSEAAGCGEGKSWEQVCHEFGLLT